MLKLFPRCRLLLTILLSIFAALVLLRAGFYWYFLSGGDTPADVLWKAFGIGVRFDFRVALFMVMPIGIISWLPGIFGLKGAIGRFVALVCTTFATGLAAIFYIFDFGHYAYLGTRLNASVLEFANVSDSRDNLLMLWESYPVIGMILLFVATLVITWFAVSFLIKRFRAQLPNAVWWRFVVSAPLIFALFFFGILGKTDNLVPLRWSDAYFTQDNNAIALGLNPMIFFLSTYNNLGSAPEADPKLLKQTYPLLVKYFGVEHPSEKDFNLIRHVAGKAMAKRPNIVFIHLESLGANRSSLYGNTLDATPYMDKIAHQGYWFPNFLVPASGTARTVFGLITGIPDVTWGGSTATRNALTSQQYTLVNSFVGYHKLYFIGGDAGWANVQGLLQHSIPDLELWEEKRYDVDGINTWGLSDYELFKQAHKRLNQLPSDKPFVAFIQLAQDHRPYTITEENNGFKKKQLDDATLYKWGFTNLAHYNAVRYQDHNLKLYLDQMVKNSHYANNTIFIMYGDHNTRSVFPTAMSMYSEDLHIDHHHVPFIIYAPGIIKTPAVKTQVATLMDLMPTALGLAGLPYENRTMGRDVLTHEGDNYALTFGGNRTSNPLIGLLSKNDFLSMLWDGKDVHYYKLDAAKTDVSKANPEIVKQRKAMLTGFYQMATYLLSHNAIKEKAQ